MKSLKKGASSKRGTQGRSASTTSGRSTSGRSTSSRGTSSRSNVRDEELNERSMGSRGRTGQYSHTGEFRDERDQEYGYGRGEQRSNDYGREGVRTISGRYSDFEDYGGSSRNWQDRDEGERGFARGGRRGEYSSTNDQDFYEGSSGRSPWRETYDTDRNDTYRGSSRSQDYGGQGRGYSQYDYDDDRVNSRGSQYGSHRGYNENADYGQNRRDIEREGRYGSSRERYSDRDERFNNYDNQDQSMEDEYGYRQRYNENRY